MAIYEKSVRLLMKDMGIALELHAGQSFTRQQAIDWFAQNYPKIKRGTIVAHLARMSVNSRIRHHYSAKPGEDDLFYQLDSSHFRLYDPAQDQQAATGPDGAASQPMKCDEESDDGTSREFAYESDLRDYLAANLSVIEPGLELYEDENLRGVEFPVGGRFIDILAVDAAGGLVVIELKVSRGYDRVVGQLARYMAWIQRELAESGQRVRGVIVAREITEDLRLACTLIPSVQLFEYELSLKLRRVED